MTNGRVNMLAILSFPHSGNHFVRFIIEFISAKPTLGCSGNRDDTPIYQKKFRNKLLLSQVRASAPPIAHKYHNAPVANVEKLVFILRDYRECIFSYQGKASESAMAHYLRLLNYYDAFQNPKLLVRYEELVGNPEQVAIKLFDFLELTNRQFLEQFRSNTEEIVSDSKNCASNLPAYKNRSGKNTTYHFERMSDNERREFRRLEKMIPNDLTTILRIAKKDFSRSNDFGNA